MIFAWKTKSTKASHRNLLKYYLIVQIDTLGRQSRRDDEELVVNLRRFEIIFVLFFSFLFWSFSILLTWLITSLFLLLYFLYIFLSLSQLDVV
jgi:hypothetical protein